MKIYQKLLFSTVGISIISIGLTSVISLQIFVSRLNVMNEEQLLFSADARKHEFQQLLDSIRLDVGSLGENPAVASMFGPLRDKFLLLGNEATDILHQRYITDSPHPVGQKHQLMSAGVDGYDHVHAQVHPFLKSHLEMAGFYDIFLIDTDGNVIYTVFKEVDFGSNVKTGPLKSSGLGKVFQKVQADKAGAMQFADFEAYGPSNNAPASFIATPLVNRANGLESLGVLVVQLPTDKITALFDNQKGLGASGHTALINKDRQAVTDTSRTAKNDAFADKVESGVLDAAFQGTEKNGLVPDYHGSLYRVAAVPIEFLGTRWAVMTAIADSEVSGPGRSLISTLLMIAGILVMFGIGAALFLARSITRPITRIVEEMTRLSHGDVSILVKDSNRKDEVGDIGRSLLTFRDGAIAKTALERNNERARLLVDRQEAEMAQERTRNEADQAFALNALSGALTRLAIGNLEDGVKDRLPDNFAAMGKNYNVAIGRLAATLSQVLDTAGEISQAGEKLSASSDDLTERTVEQATSLEQSGAALRLMMTTITATAVHAKQTSQVVNTTRDQAEASGLIVHKAVQAMEGIKASALKIADIISVIDQIAFQTNLLALNAGVEAARAGDAGRGFAVVAQEVRGLAVRCSTAAHEIAALISTSGEQVNDGATLVEETGSAILAMIERINQTHGMVEDIAASTNDQTAGLSQISVALEGMEMVTHQNSFMVQTNTTELHRLQNNIAALVDRLGQFKTGNRGLEDVPASLGRIA